MSWTHAICKDCWRKRFPKRQPVRLPIADPERCCDCGNQTTHGIYIRDDPLRVAFPNCDEVPS